MQNACSNRRWGRIAWVFPLALLIARPLGAQQNQAENLNIHPNANMLAQVPVGHGVDHAAITHTIDVPQQRSTFHLSASPKVEGGDTIKVEIVRESGTGGDYSFGLAFDPPGLVKDPPHEAVIAGGAAGWSQDVATNALPAGSGPQKLSILLSPGKGNPNIGVPRAVDVAVTEKPSIPSTPPQPVTYNVAPPQETVTRGPPMAFRVERVGGAGKSEITFQVIQDGSVLTQSVAAFDDQDRTRTIPVSNYDPCAGPPELVLLNVTGKTSADAAFSAPPGPACGPPVNPIIRLAREWWPWWTIPLVLLVAWGGYLLFRRPDPPVPEPTPDLGSSFALTFGPSTFPDGEPRLRLPDMSTAFALQMGPSSVTEPLPLRGGPDDRLD